MRLKPQHWVAVTFLAVVPLCVAFLVWLLGRALRSLFG